MSRKKRPANAQRRQQPQPSVRVPWWKRPLVWVGGLVTAIALGIAGSFGSGLGQDLFSSTVGQSSSAASGSDSSKSTLFPRTSASGVGLDVETSTFLFPGVDTAFVTKNVFEPTGKVAATLVDAPSAAYLSLFHDIGAINEGSTALRLIFTGESQQGVRILDITPTILKRAAPWHGDLFDFPLQGESPTIQTSINLDDTFPTVRDNATGQPYFEEKTITLGRGEQEVVIMQVRATRGYVAYMLRVDYLVGTQQKSVTLNDHGKPFQLSAVNCPRKDIASYGQAFLGRANSVSAARISNPTNISWGDCSPN